MKNRSWKAIAVGVISYLLGFMFLAAGGTKLAAMAPHPEHFANWGMPLWFMFVTGAVEVAAGLMLFAKRTRFVGAFMGVGTMAGALLIHAAFAEWSALGMPALLLALFTSVGWSTRPSWLPLVGSGSREAAAARRS